MCRLVYSAEAWRLLHGIVSLYKPAGMPMSVLIKGLNYSLVRDLNMMERLVEPQYLLGSSSSPAGLDISRRYFPSSQSQLIQNKMVVNLPIKELSESKHKPEPELETEPEYYEEKFTSIDRNNQLDEDCFASEDKELEEKEEKKEMVDYSSHFRLLGPAYNVEDFKFKPVNFLQPIASGVCVIGINNSTHTAVNIRNANPLVTYEIQAELGSATSTGFTDGKTVAKATWTHLKNRRWTIDQILSNIQASHQKSAWASTNVLIDSQEAYELAAKGPVRPNLLTDTLIYSIRCIEWKPPHFCLSIQCIGDRDHKFLLDLISEIGIRMKTHAHTTGIRCAQVGIFTAEDSLLPSQCDLASVINHIGQTKKIVRSKKPFIRRSNFISFNDVYSLNKHEAGDGSQVKSPKDRLQVLIKDIYN
ncbi:mitochondrial mRNA pseudouridine synthase Trub2 [Eurytemora carolleeae]|uniref:mitochondrial mRNA pseudouridine synthase Trub2 n=1 Tax=Eurytemora carolleeae TaxID=1294199 RepID=UPI000C762EDA|nr:mitochondrial mRNA pseudouridine synthase Trub2 [Eurytemora carolleeae]|eukprot:XP_023346568.1 mitochondrial mRNA pseudouridine synthase Trub2-like [Eurytemora affinis]